jgi:hypothetical protein
LNIKRRFDSLNQLRHNLSDSLVFKAQSNIRLEAYLFGVVQLFDVLKLPTPHAQKTRLVYPNSNPKAGSATKLEDSKSLVLVNRIFTLAAAIIL